MYKSQLKEDKFNFKILQYACLRFTEYLTVQIRGLKESLN